MNNEVTMSNNIPAPHNANMRAYPAFRPKHLSTLLLATTFVTGLSLPSYAARQAEYLDRGVVALPSGNGVYIGWRMLGDDPSGISFNVYRNGTRISSSPVTNSTNYFDASGTTSAAYTVRPIINGVELTANKANATWSNAYLLVNLNRPAGGTTPSGEAYSYTPNDLSTGDLDGDGQYELIVKWDPSNSKDNSQSGYTGNVYIDAYRLNGTQLWRIDLGRNIRAGAHYTQFQVYDLDGDGKAEVAMKTADGTKDGNGVVIGNSSADYRNSSGYILSGPEYLTVFNGETGTALATTTYVPARGTVSSWGDSYGNRVDRFLAGVAYLDGSRPSLIMARGYYTRAVVAAWDYRNGTLSQRWVFDSSASGNSAAAGQGAHSLSIGDADADGKDEIIYGSAAINDDGKLMYSTGLGHGDALHLGDLDPSRAGLEVFMVHETPSAYGTRGVEMHDAKTGSILWSIDGGGADVGRGVTMDLDPRYPGNESWASVGGLYTAKGALITGTKPNSTNFGIWWDGDLLREQLNDTLINKWDYANSTNTRLLTGYNFGAASNNSTKATPGLSADLLGDWREEVIWRMNNSYQLIIFSTTAVTSYKLRTLMHDPQYRLQVAHENTGYNQPPHPSFFLGDGMSTPAAPSLSFVGKNPNSTVPTSSSSATSTSKSSSSTSTSVAMSTSSKTSSSASSSSATTGGATCTYVVSNEWNTGFTAAIQIKNNGTTAINGWTVNWSYSDGTSLTGSWNATLSGTNPYAATNLSWNGSIQPSTTVEFGFQGNKGTSTAALKPTVTGNVCK
jgi:rhamnogalacturonan endolyase